MVCAALERDGIPGAGVLDLLEATPQSVILYDDAGRRAINVDLKNIQETPYPPEAFEAARFESLQGTFLAKRFTFRL